MADLFKNLFGSAKPSQPAPKKADADFADFSAAPEPVPEAPPNAATVTGTAAGPLPTGPPYTKWYNVHERHSLSEFKIEGLILATAALVFVFHILGARLNRSKARAWIRAHAPVLKSEFALVGFGGAPIMDTDVDDQGLIKEKSLYEFATYATGRQNTAFMDVKLTLSKRFNPIVNLVETAASFFSDSFAPPADVMEASMYPFDGKEDLTVPLTPGSVDARARDAKSTYEGFVWAVVNKDRMQRVREERYDVTLTSTRDHPKLPNWLTVMSESSEITDALLTKELIDAVVAADDTFEYLIVTDQPTNRPKTLDETTPRKRLHLRYRLPSDNGYGALVPLLSYFVRMPDRLVQAAHFRPEVMKKVRATREAMIAQIRKADQDERNEERTYEKEKTRKAKRDAELKGLDAKAQKKYLEKEKEKELRRSQKKMTMRG